MQAYRGNSKGSTTTIILPLVLFVGLLTTGYGFFEGEEIVLSGGLAVTIAGMVFGIIRLLTSTPGLEAAS